MYKLDSVHGYPNLATYITELQTHVEMCTSNSKSKQI